MADSKGDLPLNIAIKRGSKEVSDALQWTIDLERQDEAVSNTYVMGNRLSEVGQLALCS